MRRSGLAPYTGSCAPRQPRGDFLSIYGPAGPRGSTCMHATTLARDQIWTKGQLNSYRILGHSKLLSAEEEKSSPGGMEQKAYIRT